MSGFETERTSQLIAKQGNSFVPPISVGNGMLWYRANGDLVWTDEKNISSVLVPSGGLVIPTPTPTPTPVPTPVTPPPTTPPTPPPSAGSSVWTQGNTIFSSATTTLADFDSGSVTSVGSEAVTVVTGGSNPFGSGSAFKFAVDATHSDEIDVWKDLSGSQVRDIKFDFRIDSAATLTDEETITMIWTDTYKSPLLQLRVKPSTISGKFIFLFRTPGLDNFASMVKQSNVAFAKNTTLHVEIYMTDNSFVLLVNSVVLIEWYNGFSITGNYFAFNNAGLYFGVTRIGKFFSTQLNGNFFVQNVSFYNDYVAPNNPVNTDLTGQITDAWAGWKARYLRSDGAIVRPYPEGVTTVNQPPLNSNNWSDVVSEGLAYGLMLAVQMNDQTTFDLIETWIEANVVRSLNSMSAGHLMAWHYDDINNAVYDWNWASDAEVDRAQALIWAAHRKANGNSGWSSSVLNYSTLATNVLADLKSSAFRADSPYQILTSDSFQSSADPALINPSYMNPAAFKLFKDFTSDTFWDAARSGAYYVYNLMQTTTMTGFAAGDSAQSGKAQSGALPCDWAGYSLTNHNLASSPPNSQANNQDIEFRYDAFRVPTRVYWDWLFYQNSLAQQYLTGNLFAFYQQQWSSNNIWAEYYHNGQVYGQYEKTMMTFNGYFCGKANNLSDATASSIYTNKLNGLFAKVYPSGFFRDNEVVSGNNGFVGASGYYGNTWTLFDYLVVNNAFTNF